MIGSIKNQYAMAFGKNQRKNLRVRPEKNFPIRIDINGSNFVDILAANDISCGGIGISVPHQFEGCEIGEPVALIVQLPSPVKKSFSVQASIKHVSQKTFGVVFIDLSKKNHRKIQEYIRYRIRNESWVTRFQHKLEQWF